jgi:RNA polymerase sigma-70 factor (ECF subfamily)
MQLSEDAILVEQILAGDKQAYARLVNLYKRQIYNLAYRMTMNRDVAQDLSQETFIRAYTNLHRYNTDMSFLNWLYTICLNLTRNHLKKKREVLSDSVYESTGIEQQEMMAEDYLPEGELIQRQESTVLQRALLELPEDLRETVVLRYLQELPFDTIAQNLGLSLSAAKMRTYRGLEKLREMLSGQRDGNET